jgi:prepilin-type N-terminal cleavage/methylation domain-containing protein
MRMRTRFAGFTLIELLAGMAVLTILVLLLTRVFSESTRLMLQGTKRLENVIAGRSAMHYMAREISGAIDDDLLSMSLVSDKDTMLENSTEKADRLYFCSAQGRPDAIGERQVRQIMYRTMEMRDFNGVIMPNRMRLVCL